MLESHEAKRRVRFFDTIAKSFKPETRLSCIVITHLLSDRPFFLRALNQIVDIKAVLPKPKSIDPDTRSLLREEFTIDSLSRDAFETPTKLLEFLDKYAPNSRVVLMDVGGYFAPALQDATSPVLQRVVGVVEDTENGQQKYERLGNLPCPVISVARSPLKNSEDYLVGHAIVFSTEALLRENHDILVGRAACVIGYGKLGRSIAHLLHAKHVRVTIFDDDPIKLTEAASHGFSIRSGIHDALRGAGLVVCATGNCSITKDDYDHLQNGAYVVTVTSSDDELDMYGLKEWYKEQHLSEYLTRYTTQGHYFYLLNRGNAVNFVHGAHVGPFIFLVQSEILAAASRLATQGCPPGLHEMSPEARRKIAKLWIDDFGGNLQ